MIGESIKYNLQNLARFSGRDRQGQFWPYAIVAFLTGVAVMAVAIMPPIFMTMNRMRAFAEANPDQATITTGPGGTSIQIEGSHPELMPDIGAMVSGIAIAVALIVILLAGAITRRLHDTNRTGLWGVIPVVFLTTGLVGMAHLFGSDEPSGTVFLLLFLNNIIYLGSLLLLVIFLIPSGTPGPNRFGEAPAMPRQR